MCSPEGNKAASIKSWFMVRTLGLDYSKEAIDTKQLKITVKIDKVNQFKVITIFRNLKNSRSRNCQTHQDQ